MRICGSVVHIATLGLIVTKLLYSGFGANQSLTGSTGRFVFQLTRLKTKMRRSSAWLVRHCGTSHFCHHALLPLSNCQRTVDARSCVCPALRPQYLYVSESLEDSFEINAMKFPNLPIPVSLYHSFRWREIVIEDPSLCFHASLGFLSGGF